MRLLLVEDDANVAAVLAETFQAEGHQTTVMPTGEAALSYLQTDRPDAVILDIMLPNINGIEVLRAIRAEDPALPVIIISGRGTPEQLAEARHLGVTEIIGKPDILNRFTEALARVGRKAPTQGPRPGG
jgi:two-component system response regulator CpxR